jgi:hypothetical protein
MSNSNGYNPNSLFALEQSLLSNNPAYRAEQFSAEDIEESEQDQNRGVEAQAFDWDDAIALEYDEDTDPDSESMSEQDTEELEDEAETARSMSWQNYGYASRGFDLEDEDTPTYDVQAFAVEEEETAEGDDDPLSHSNSLFALEQSVFGVTRSYQASEQFAVDEEEEVPSESIESQAFDWDEAIALEYDESAYDDSPHNNRLLALEQSLTVMQPDSQGMSHANAYGGMIDGARHRTTNRTGATADDIFDSSGDSGYGIPDNRRRRRSPASDYGWESEDSMQDNRRRRMPSSDYIQDSRDDIQDSRDDIRTTRDDIRTSRNRDRRKNQSKV